MGAYSRKGGSCLNGWLQLRKPSCKTSLLRSQRRGFSHHIPPKRVLLSGTSQRNIRFSKKNALFRDEKLRPFLHGLSRFSDQGSRFRGPLGYPSHWATVLHDPLNVTVIQILFVTLIISASYIYVFVMNKKEEFPKGPKTPGVANHYSAYSGKTR